MKLTMLDRDLATSMIEDLDDVEGQMFPPSRVSQQFRYALAELDLAHQRVAELEALSASGQRAIDALEQIGEQARERIVDLCGWARYALEHWAPGGSDKAEAEKMRALVERTEAETVRTGDEPDRYAAFVALRDELLAADVCLACGDHTPGRTCQCENDE